MFGILNGECVVIMAWVIVVHIIGCVSATDMDISMALKLRLYVSQYSPISALTLIHLCNYISIHIIQARVSHSSSYTALHCSVTGYVLL